MYLLTYLLNWTLDHAHSLSPHGFTSVGFGYTDAGNLVGVEIMSSARASPTCLIRSRWEVLPLLLLLTCVSFLFRVWRTFCLLPSVSLIYVFWWAERIPWSNPFNAHIKAAEQLTILCRNTAIGTLVVDGWAVAFGTARRRLGGLRSRPVPSSLYLCQK